MRDVYLTSKAIIIASSFFICETRAIIRAVYDSLATYSNWQTCARIHMCEAIYRIHSRSCWCDKCEPRACGTCEHAEWCMSTRVLRAGSDDVIDVGIEWTIPGSIPTNPACAPVYWRHSTCIHPTLSTQGLIWVPGSDRRWGGRGVLTLILIIQCVLLCFLYSDDDDDKLCWLL